MDEFYDYIITKPNMEDILEHHGVKGMRWGHRKERFRGKGKIAKYRENKKSQRVINSKEEKAANKLPKKWDYVEPQSKKQAHAQIAAKGAAITTAITLGNIGVNIYLNKKIMEMPMDKAVKKAFSKQAITSSVVKGLVMGASNIAVDELLYYKKGVIRK